MVGIDLNLKTFLVITGASRGIGQMMAIKMANKLKAGSVMLLVARSEEGLAKTKTIIRGNIGNSIKVQTVSMDLSTATAYQFYELLRDCLSTLLEQALNFERAIVIHNAGTVGDVSKRASDVSNTITWTEYFHTNFFSVVSLNCEFFRIFARIPKIVVNISSKCAEEPFASMCFYCTGKAARDMYFRVLAAEEEQALILNYAPGAIDTDMTVLVQEETINVELSAAFKRQRDAKTMLTTEETTNMFIKILEEKKFKSGDHVDYWD